MSIPVILGVPDKLPLLTPVTKDPIPIPVKSSTTTVVLLVTAPSTVSVVVQYQSAPVNESSVASLNLKPNP